MSDQVEEPPQAIKHVSKCRNNRIGRRGTEEHKNGCRGVARMMVMAKVAPASRMAANPTAIWESRLMYRTRHFLGKTAPPPFRRGTVLKEESLYGMMAMEPHIAPHTKT